VAIGTGPSATNFTIITTRANRLIEPIDDRMPVILGERTAEEWISPGQKDHLRLKSLLVPAPDDKLVPSPASSLVNNVNNEGPELLMPDPTTPAQQTVF
jgi:putative SOS response-associated peptidase YedK